MTQTATLAAPIDDDPDHAPIDHVILTADSPWHYDIADTRHLASVKLGKFLQQDEARFRHATIVTLDDYVAAREQSYLDDPIVEISAERFHEALNCLPPLEWRRADGVERFCLSEFTTGRITAQYACFGERYFTRSVRYRDEGTYLTAASITAALEAGAVQPDEAR